MTGRKALAITLASIAAGALNYLYQLHAVAVLDREDFGRLSTWLARVGVAATAATVVQFLSLDAPLSPGRVVRWLRAGAVVGVVAMAVLVGAGSRLDPSWLGVGTVAGTILLYALLGQLQAQLRLGVVTAVLFASTLVRFALPFVWPAAARVQAFYIAQAAASFVGMLLAASLVHDPGPTAPPPAQPKARFRIGRPVLLAFATVVFPLLDVLVVSSTENAATTGAFSRAQLASRVVFFGGTAAMSILLPHELHAARHGGALPRVPALVARWLVPAILAFAIVTSVAVDIVLLHPRGSERVWLHATCLEAALLVGVLGRVNSRAVRGDLRGAVRLTGGVVASTLLATAVGHAWPALGVDAMTRYVLAALFGDAVVLVAARGKP
ncbi:MAG: hypothetical protein JWP97_2065 [Labilithrix sp.]|nr:hypothetical protein [Labilithrix sp.]